MADETPNADISLSLAVPGADQLGPIVTNLDKFIERVKALIPNLDKLGGTAGVNRLSKDLGALLSQLDKGAGDVRLLNAVEAGASRASRAVQEQLVQNLLKVPQALGAASRSNDLGKLELAAEAYGRRIVDATLAIQRLRDTQTDMSARELRANQTAIRNAERALALDQQRIGKVNELTFALREQERIASGVAGRQRSIQVARAFEDTPEGRKQASDRAAAQQRGLEVADATALDRQIRQQKAEQLRAERAQRAQEVADAQEFDRQRTEAQRSTSGFQANQLSERARNNIGVQQAFGADPVNLATQAAAQNAALRNRQAVQAFQREQAPELFQRAEGRDQATIFGFQAQIQAQYTLINKVFDGFREATSAVLEFDKASAELQAITGASNTEIGGLRDTILDITKAVPFTTREIIEAATALAKTGISASEISSSLKTVAQVAGATGGTLRQVAEIFTTVFDTYNVGGAESAKIGDQLVAVINRTRLSSETFGEAFQAVGVTAKENGLSFTETTAALGALADAGLRSGSLLGTGLRQVLIELDEPPKKLADRFRELGLTSTDLNVKLNTLPGVLENLKQAGFTTADVFETFSGRTAQAFAAALTSTEDYKVQLSAALNSSGAAANANGIRILSLTDQLKLLGNQFTEVAIRGSGPLVGALKVVVSGLTSVAGLAGEAGAGLSVMGTIMSGIAAAAFLGWLNSVLGVGKLVTSTVQGLTTAFRTYAAAAAIAGEATAAVVVAEGALTALAAPFALLAAGITVAIAVLGHFGEETGGVTAATTKARDAVTNTTTALKDHSSKLDEINEFLATTTLRSAALKRDQDLLNLTVEEARSKFGDLSLGINQTITSYDGLIAKVIALRNEQRAGQGIDLAQNKDALEASNKEAASRLDASRARNSGDRLNSLLGASVSVAPDSGAVTYGGIPSSVTDQPGLAEVLQILRAPKGSRAPTTEELGRARYNVDHSSLDETQKSGLKAALDDLVGIVRDLSKNAADLSSNTAQTARNRLEQSAGFQNAETGFSDSGRLLSQLPNIKGTQSLNDSLASFNAIRSQLDAELASVATYRQTLSEEERRSFDTTKLAQQVNTAKATLQREENELIVRVAANDADQAKLSIEELNKRIEAGKAALGRTKDADSARVQGDALLELERSRARIQRTQGNAELDKRQQEPTYNSDNSTADRARLNAQVDETYNKGAADIEAEVKKAQIAAIDNTLKDLQSQIRTTAKTGGGRPATLASGNADFERMIREASDKYQVDPELMIRLVNRESGGRQTDSTGKIVTSPTGNKGLTQLGDKTAADLGVNSADPAQNIDGGIRYYSQLLKKYNGDQNKALAAYNWGPDRVDKWIASGGPGEALPLETQLYLGALGVGTNGNGATAPLFDRQRQLQAQRDQLSGLSPQAQAENQDRINQEQQRLGVTRSVNRPFDERQPLDSVAANANVKAINDEAANATKQANLQVENLTTFINAAGSLKNFPAATLAQKQKELQAARQAADEADARIQQVRADKLNKELISEQQALEATNAAIAQLESKFNVGPDAVGAPRFGSEEERTEFSKSLSDFQRNQAALQASIAKTRSDIENANTSINKYTIEGQARAQAQNPQDGGIGAGFGNAVSTFTKSHGFDETTQKQTADVLTSTFNSVDQAFAKFSLNFINGNNKNKQSFSDFVSSIIQSAETALVNKAVSSLLNSALSGFGSLFGVGGKSAISGEATQGATSETSSTGSAGGLFGAIGSIFSSFLYQGGVIRAYQGMTVPKYAGGGIVPGVHVGRDTTPAMLAPGEAVLNRSAVSMVGEDMVNSMNNGAISHAPSMPALPPPSNLTSNVYVVDKNTQPTLGPHDVLAIVRQDILAGGATKKLLKQVSLGQL